MLMDRKDRLLAREGYRLLAKDALPTAYSLIAYSLNRMALPTN